MRRNATRRPAGFALWCVIDSVSLVSSADDKFCLRVSFHTDLKPVAHQTAVHRLRFIRIFYCEHYSTTKGGFQRIKLPLCIPVVAIFGFYFEQRLAQCSPDKCCHNSDSIHWNDRAH